jgi:hypothetical protein
MNLIHLVWNLKNGYLLWVSRGEKLEERKLEGRNLGERKLEGRKQRRKVKRIT